MKKEQTPKETDEELDENFEEELNKNLDELKEFYNIEDLEETQENSEDENAEASVEHPTAKRGVAIAYDVISTVCMAVAGVAIILILFFRLAQVEGNSMNPTLSNGDSLLITPVSNHYVYGDIVVIHRINDTSLVKRVIASAGDTIDIDFSQGIVYLNGKELEEDYILEPTYHSFPDGPDFPLTVPEGYVFVMGDNRNNSLDSRSGAVGLVDEQFIVGKMVYCLGNLKR